MYELLGICLALTALLTFNAFASLLAALLWRGLRKRAQDWPAGACAQLLFALRVFPGALAVTVVFALLLPAYVAHEPRELAEPVSGKLALLALFSAAGLLLAVWRGIAAWLATRRLINNWLQNSDRITLAPVPIPAYRLRHQFPVVAVAGSFRPRLFIAEQLFDSLSRDELDAVIAHECGHLAARDNFKRALLRVCRDALSAAPCGRSLDQDWTRASEVAADEYAARDGCNVAMDLASALIKIARLIPAGAKPASFAGASLICGDPGEIVHRVQRLTSFVAPAFDRRVRPPLLTPSLLMNAAVWSGPGAVLAATIFIASTPQLLQSVHEMIEVVVSMLQ